MRVKILVNSPFQVIGAWEFQEHLPRHLSGDQALDFDLVLVNAGTARSVEQTRRTAERLELPFRELGRGDGSSGTRERFDLVRRELAELAPDDLVAAGNPTFDLYADALGRRSSMRGWVLDDGLGNWAHLEALATGGVFPRHRDTGALRGMVKRLVLGRRRVPAWAEIDWFSVFARYLPRHERLHQNSLVRLRERSRVPVAPASVHGEQTDVLFLGSPLVSVGILDERDFAEMMRHAAGWLEQQYPGCRRIYVRHRSEQARDDGARWFDDAEESTGPVELRWLSGANVPQAVAGVFSTALFTLGELLRGVSDVVSLWPSDGFTLRARRPQLQQLLPLFRAGDAADALRLVEIRR